MRILCEAFGNGEHLWLTISTVCMFICVEVSVLQPGLPQNKL